MLLGRMSRSGPETRYASLTPGGSGTDARVQYVTGQHHSGSSVSATRELARRWRAAVQSHRCQHLTRRPTRTERIEWTAKLPNLHAGDCLDQRDSARKTQEQIRVAVRAVTGVCGRRAGLRGLAAGTFGVKRDVLGFEADIRRPE
jgi:hypothetical protein